MKDLKDMSFKEVLIEIGICSTESDFGIFIENQELSDKFSKILLHSADSISDEYILKFLRDNEKDINIPKFVLTQLYRMESVLDDIKSINKKFIVRQSDNDKTSEKDILEKIKKARELLKNYKGSIIVFDSTFKYEIINMEILNGNKKSAKNSQRLEELDNEDRDLDLICKTLSTMDIPELVSSQDPNFSKELIDYIGRRTITITFPKYDASEEEIFKHMKTSEYTEESYKQLKNALKEYSRFVQVDKMLLIGIYKTLNYIENKQLYGMLCRDIRKQLYNIYDKLDPRFKSNGKVNITKNKEINGEEISEKITITSKDIKRMLDENFIGDNFIGEETIEYIRSEIFESNVPLVEYDPRVIKLLGINMDELMQILNNPLNFEYLMQYKMISDEVLKYVLNTKKNMPIQIYEQLLNNETIDKQYILDLYSDGIITLEQIKELNESSELHIEEIAQEEEMIRLYKEFYMYGKDEETFNSYMQLYKELRVKGKDISEKRENGNRLVEELGEDFEEEDLKQMYKLGIIPVDTAIEWGGDSITQDMFNKGILKPIDAKRLYKENVLNLNMIKQVLRSREISDEDKLALIGSTFDDEEDFEIKMELMQYLNLVADENSSKSKGQKHSKRTNSTVLDTKNAYITDPFARWQLISLLDNEYSQEVLKDGYIIFELPNVNNGTVIIEKMFKKFKNKVVPSYGNATYILSKNQFDKSKKYIIDETLSGKIVNLGELAEVKETENADRLNHSSKWGSNIKEYFEVGKEQSRYTEEQIQKIDKTIESIENSRRLK